MKGLRLGLSLTGARFNPLSLFAGGVVGGWYDPSDLSTLWKDTAGTDPVTAHGDAVARMDDKSGNGNHLTQNTAANRPLYQVSGTERYLLFDGTNDALFDSSASLNSFPFDRISAIQQVSWTTGDDLFASSTAAASALRQRGSSPAIQINDGTTDVVTNSGLAIGANGVVTERHISGASQLAVNNGAYSTGNAGTTAPGGGIFVGDSTGVKAANMRLYGFVVRAGTMTDAQIANLRRWLGAKCGVAL